LGARLLSSSLAPVGAMFHDPIQQSLLKADISSGFLAFDPLMFQNLGTLRQKLLVQDRILNEMRMIRLRRWHLRSFFHKIGYESTKSKQLNSTEQPSDLFNLRL